MIEKAQKLMIHIKQWASPPEFPDEEETSIMAEILNRMELVLLGLLFFMAIFFVPIFVSELLWPSWAIIAILALLNLVSRRFLFKGQLEISALLTTVPAWILFYLIALVGGGINSPLIPIIIASTIVISFIVHSKLKYFFLALGILLSLVLAFVHSVPNNFIPDYHFTPLASWFLFSISIVFIFIFIDTTITNLKKSLQRFQVQTEARVEAEQALSQSEERFRRFMDFFPGLAYIKNARGDVLFANLGFKTYLGMNPEDMIGKNNLELFGKEFAEKIHQDDQRVIESERTQVFEEEFGGKVWSTHKFTISQPGQKPLLGGVTIDITERIEVEKKLKESEEFFKESQRAANIGSYFNDFASDSWESSEVLDQIFGIDKKFERNFQSWIDLIHPDDREMMSQYYLDEVVKKGRTFNKEYRIIRRTDGATRWVLGLGRISLNKNGTPISMTGTIQDITDRKLAEEALRESENRFGTLLQSVSSIAVQGFAPDGTVHFWNKASEQLYGYSSEEAVGRNLFDLIVPPEDQDQLRCCLQDMMKTGQVPAANEYLLRNKNGTRVPVISSPAILNSPFHSPELFCIDIDLTDRKKAEKELAQTQALIKAIVDNTTDIIWSVDPENFGLLTWNPTYENYFRVHRNIEVKAGLRPEDLYPPDSGYVEIWKDHYKNALQNGSFTTEYKAFANNDIFQISLNPLQQDGRVFGISVFGEIITERKKAEALIEQSERKYRELFKVNKDGITIHFQSSATMPGAFVEVNEAAPNILGYTSEEMLSLTPLDLEPTVSKEQLIFRNMELENFGNASYETTFRNKSGRHVFVDISCQKVEYDNKPAIMTIIRDITDRKQHENELQAIATLSSALRTAPGRSEMLPVIVEQIVNLLDCDSATIEIIESGTNDVVVEAAHGLWEPLIGSRQKEGTGINAIIAATRQPYLTQNLEKDPGLFYHHWARYGIRGSAGVPLIAQEQLIGFIWVGRRSDITQNEVRLLGAITDIAANAIYRSSLHEQTLKDASELADAYETTLEGWAKALELREQETAGHSKRVVKYTLELAKKFGFSANNLIHIRRGASLHDIGKMGIPDKILLKKGPLTPREWVVMRRHPVHAYKLLSKIPYLLPALEIPHYHHERWDGSGYPEGLKGNDIPLSARIFAVVDVWDALLSNRPYRKAWSNDEVVNYLRDNSGKLFDPEVVETFLSLLENEKKE